MFQTKTNRRFWLAMALAPLIFYALLIFRSGANAVALDVFLSNTLGFLNNNNNIVLKLFIDLFGSNGLIPCFSTNGLFLLISWWFYIKLFHIIIDLLTFLPDICSSLISTCTRRKDDDKM